MNTTLAISSLHQAAVPPSDLARSITFYRDLLGLRFIAQFSPPGLAFFSLGETRLLVEASADATPGGGALYFRVADIRGATAALKARGLAFDQEAHAIHRDDDGTFGEPGTTDWMAFFRDPDGNLLALVSRVSPERSPQCLAD